MQYNEVDPDKITDDVEIIDVADSPVETYVFERDSNEVDNDYNIEEEQHEENTNDTLFE
jgi:hypothetical protein